jgi:hypothetical protein
MNEIFYYNAFCVQTFIRHNDMAIFYVHLDKRSIYRKKSDVECKRDNAKSCVCCLHEMEGRIKVNLCARKKSFMSRGMDT